MKRILHYSILAIVLLGAPALCAWLGGYDEIWEGVKSFPPRTEDWGFQPEKLWNHRCPFSWPWFIGLSLFTFVCLRPLVKRCLKSLVHSAWCLVLGAELKHQNGHGSNAPSTKHQAPSTKHQAPSTFPWWGWLGVAILASGWILSWNYHFRWFPPLPERVQVQLSYAPVWAGFILLVNALCVKRSGHSPMTDHPWAYAALFPASSLFWWFFEYLNRYVWNWYYVGISHLGAMEYTIYATVCFASVLPGVCSVAAFLHTFRPFSDENYANMGKVNMRGWRAISVLSFVAALGLAGIVFFPRYTFPLLWLSPLMVFLLVQVALKEPCALDCLAVGNWSVVFRFALAALVCGLCWETWNYYALAKWIYSVPFVHRFQIWEMPLIGFGGYLPFGMECAAVTAWICPELIENGER